MPEPGESPLPAWEDEFEPFLREQLKDPEFAYAYGRAQAQAEARAAAVQRQDSLYDQMVDVLSWARANGCYDAYDWIADRFAGADWSQPKASTPTN